MQVMMLKQKI